MKTPMQELIDSVGNMAQGLDADELYDYFVEKATQMLEKEKEVMIDFAYKFGDEPLLEIAKWYDKQFNTEEK